MEASVNLRATGSARLSLAVRAPDEPDPLLAAVREAAGREYTVLGELGRTDDGTVAYLARDATSSRLLAFRVTPSGAPSDYVLDLAGQLDQSVPAPPSTCPACRASVRGWARFCTQCGRNLWSDEAAGARWAKEELLDAVRDATRGKYEILGEMDHAGGKGSVYFARDVASGRLEALRLEREGGSDYSIGLTGVLQSFADGIGKRRSRGA
jgi:hypothetical protein